MTHTIEQSQFLGLLEAYGTLTVAEIRKMHPSWTDVFVRQMAKNLNFMGVPVVSNDDGFWIATTPEEIDAYVGNLKSRISGISERISALTAIKTKMVTENPQLSLLDKLKQMEKKNEK